MNYKIQEILNLNPNKTIGKELTDRQLKVITKSYEFLCKKGNNVFYIADEVGLGKTYIAAGIIMLFRHFSIDKNIHKDLIIVPKKNLQSKWKKDLSNFQKNNYLISDAEIKKQYEEDLVLQERIYPINNAITIFRMTSFSGIASNRHSQKAQYDYLNKVIFKQSELTTVILDKARKLEYFYKRNSRKLKRLVSYLLNICSPHLNCVVIDEAHNYKYGLQGLENNNLSIRNDTTAHFLGTIKDVEILNDFPEIKDKIKFPLAKKVICLSATPKDRNLIEIKNQLNCFTNKHILTNVSNDKIKEKLHKFLVRGNLEYILKEETVSRNKCIHEHRKGNVDKIEDGKPIEIKDNFESIFWQLIQYKSIKYLRQKPNPSFEIGMLAGFETYNTDVSNRIQKELTNNGDYNEDEINQKDSEREYDLIKNKKNNKSQDLNVIRTIVNSYKETFSNIPPHPKLSKLVNELTKQLNNQEKSLIFARRVATVYEIEKRLLEKYEKEIVINKQLKFFKKPKYYTNKVTEMLDLYKYREIIEKIDDVFDIILSKRELKTIITDKNIDAVKAYLKKSFIKADIRTNFKKLIEDFIIKNKTNISSKLKKATIIILKDFTDSEILTDNEVEKDEDDNIISNYFFSNFFKKKYGEKGGFIFKQKIYKSTWFTINIVQLNTFFKFISIPKFKTIAKKTDNSFKKINDEIESLFSELKTSEIPFNFKHKKYLKTNSILKKNTFITSLLIKFHQKEFKIWLNKRNNNIQNFILDFKLLDAILLNIFRNGTGLLLSYLVDSTNLDFEKTMLELLLEEPFKHIIEEIRTILNDFDLIVEQNFSDDNKNTDQVKKIFKSLTPIIGTTGQNKGDKSIIAKKFRMPGFPYILVTTDIFREGEDLHTYCQNVYHYGIAWNPSDMQQRTGRIDRINSMSYRKLNRTQELCFENKIQVFYPYLNNSVEVNQVIQLFENLNKFVRTFNEIDKNYEFKENVVLDKEYTKDNIPKQITERIKSKYDINSFNYL